MTRPIVSWIDQHAARTPDAVALVDLATDRGTTYAELARRVDSLAGALAGRLGIDRGDRVAVLTRNDARFFELLYACAKAGAILVPLNWRLSEEELVAVTADATPSLLVTESWAAPTARVVAAATGIDTVLTWASEPGDPDDYEELATLSRTAGAAAPVVDEDDPWTIIYTSGTTGRPKGVVATHRNVLASALGIVIGFDINARTRSLTVLPTFHVAGLNIYANPTLFMGGTVVVMRSFDPELTLRLLTATRSPITHFNGVPAIYQFIQQLPEFADTQFGPMVAIAGGAPVPETLIQDWAAHGVRVRNLYGITEAGACVLSVPEGRELDRLGTVGLPMLHAEVRVRPHNGTEPGELQIRGALVTPGYWDRPEATVAAFTDDGWLRTGDAATVDPDGYVRLVDRWKDMYISGGENVYPAEVENVLHQHPDVSQAAVVGVPHPRWGETGVGFVVPAPGTTPSAEELIAYCAARIARYKVPDRVELVDELPRNATGKVLKQPLRQRAVS